MIFNLLKGVLNQNINNYYSVYTDIQYTLINVDIIKHAILIGFFTYFAKFNIQLYWKKYVEILTNETI